MLTKEEGGCRPPNIQVVKFVDSPLMVKNIELEINTNVNIFSLPHLSLPHQQMVRIIITSSKVDHVLFKKKYQVVSFFADEGGRGDQDSTKYGCCNLSTVH